MNDSNNMTKKTLEEKRQSILQYIEQLDYLENSQKEKMLLKIVRISENIYRDTYSNKDKNVVIDNYIRISDFYQKNNDKPDLVVRWYQKIVGVLEQSCEKYSSNDEYRNLIEWYVTTINSLIDLNDYQHILSISKNMKKRAVMLYKKTRTIEDLKMILLAKLYLANANDCLKNYIKAYLYYYSTSKEMLKIYEKYKDEGLRQDLLNIYEYIIELTKKPLLKIFHKKWVIKRMILKENKYV